MDLETAMIVDICKKVAVNGKITRRQLVNAFLEVCPEKDEELRSGGVGWMIYNGLVEQVKLAGLVVVEIQSVK